MGRPPSTDRKEVVTLRLHQSVIDAYKAAGEDWRARMEAAITAGLKPPEPVKVAAPKPVVQKAAPAKASLASVPYVGDLKRGPLQKGQKR